MPPGSGVVVRAMYECSREMTRVHERLRALGGLSESGFAGFLGILRMASASWLGNGRTSVVRVFTRVDESPREITSVYERCTDCLNQDLPDSWGFSGWRVPPGSGMVVRAFTRDYKSLHAIMAVTRDARIVESMSESTASGSESIARESTSVYKRLQEFACVHGRFKRCHELRT